MRAKLPHPANVTIALKLSKLTAKFLLVEANRAGRTRSGQARYLIERALTEQTTGGDDARA